MPGVLLRALSEYKFVGSPLWRMSDGKDLVRVELTFHKALPTKPYYKKWAESRRKPAPSAGDWPRQPTAATRPSTTTRSTPARRQPTMEREMPPPPTQTLPDTTSHMIAHRLGTDHAENTSSNWQSYLYSEFGHWKTPEQQRSRSVRAEHVNAILTANAFRAGLKAQLFRPSDKIQ